MTLNTKRSFTYTFFSFQVILRLVARRRSPVVWAHPRCHYWWDTIVPDFTSVQFMQNFRVSRESFDYICSRVQHVIGRMDTNYRLCVPNQKRVAIAIWKLATGSEYRTISHLFGCVIVIVFRISAARSSKCCSLSTLPALMLRGWWKWLLSFRVVGECHSVLGQSMEATSLL